MKMARGQLQSPLMPPAGDALRLVGVSKLFGGLRVFENVGFEIMPGEVLGVIGPNGAGKTTLINVISGSLAPTSGHIYLGGREVTKRPVHALSRLGLVRSFQQSQTFNNVTVRQNIRRAIRFSGGDDSAWGGLADLFQAFELDSRLDELTDSLPYGLQKVLGLVMAYATRPKVLLLDEPAAGLERSERTRIDDFVRYARSTIGCSILIVEHDLELIRRLCPNIMVLDGGEVLASGPTGEVLSRKEVIDAYIGETLNDDE
jgi:ABC-type branched-subunit amino acid transport system ATPase component